MIDTTNSTPVANAGPDQLNGSSRDRGDARRLAVERRGRPRADLFVVADGEAGRQRRGSERPGRDWTNVHA